jgi:hypothetical protein
LLSEVFEIEIIIHKCCLQLLNILSTKISNNNTSNLNFDLILPDSKTENLVVNDEDKIFIKNKLVAHFLIYGPVVENFENKVVANNSKNIENNIQTNSDICNNTNNDKYSDNNIHIKKFENYKKIKETMKSSMKKLH